MNSGDITKEQDPLERILAELGALRGEVNALANKVASLETRQGRLEERVEKKLLETKPIWVAELSNRIDALDSKIDEVEHRLEAKIDAKVDALRADMEKGFHDLREEMKKGFYELGYKVRYLSEQGTELGARQRYLEELVIHPED